MCAAVAAEEKGLGRPCDSANLATRVARGDAAPRGTWGLGEGLGEDRGLRRGEVGGNGATGASGIGCSSALDGRAAGGSRVGKGVGLSGCCACGESVPLLLLLAVLLSGLAAYPVVEGLCHT